MRGTDEGPQAHVTTMADTAKKPKALAESIRRAAHFARHYPISASEKEKLRNLPWLGYDTYRKRLEP